jgi:hypothetical protein
MPEQERRDFGLLVAVLCEVANQLTRPLLATNEDYLPLSAVL